MALSYVLLRMYLVGLSTRVDFASHRASRHGDGCCLADEAVSLERNSRIASSAEYTDGEV